MNRTKQVLFLLKNYFRNLPAFYAGYFEHLYHA